MQVRASGLRARALTASAPRLEDAGVARLLLNPRLLLVAVLLEAVLLVAVLLEAVLLEDTKPLGMHDEPRAAMHAALLRHRFVHFGQL